MTESIQHMRFDPQLRARTPELIESVKHFTRYLIAAELKIGLRTRARRDDDRRKFAVAVEAVACNLLLLNLLQGGVAMAAPLGSDMMWGAGRYRNPVYGEHFRSLLALMERLKLLKRIQKGYHVSKTTKAPSLFKTTTGFGKHFPSVTTDSFRCEQGPEILVLKERKDNKDKAALVSYRDSQKTRRLRNQVQRLNDFLLNADIELGGARSSARLADDGEVIATYRRTVRRTFNNKSWQQGGRLAGGFWMTMKKVDRFQRLRLSGEPVADVDYQQLFPRLAYARARAPQPTGDLYDVMGDRTGRDGWKLLFNALLFTRGTLKRWPLDCSPLLPGLNLKEAVARLKEKHRPIAHLFGTGVGFALMFMESEMLITVVTHLFEKGIVALPLHDAVLVAKPHAETAKAAMEDAFRLQTGQDRAFVTVGFSPRK
ncbi:MAG: hypothetical protein EKK36_05350 [Bradyrhizobiaceae bacterium]|nr:MAG: hypothetical protein EKK36_05350 [Bradyrhizobiaceae bacterium]